MREDFEAWFKNQHSQTVSLWDVWQASRKAIVITAPPFVTSRAALEVGHTVDYSNGHGDAMDAYELVLKEAGITIKGEE